MGALLQKMFGPGAPPLVIVDTTGACSSECCDEVEEVSSSFTSSEPHTHLSVNAATESYNTIPDIANIACSSWTSVVAPKVSQTSGGKVGMKL